MRAPSTDIFGKLQNDPAPPRAIALEVLVTVFVENVSCIFPFLVMGYDDGALVFRGVVDKGWDRCWWDRCWWFIFARWFGCIVRCILCRCSLFILGVVDL